MAYNGYNTRNSARFNAPGRFVSGGELAPGGPVGVGARSRPHYNHPNNQRQNQFRPHQQQHTAAASKPQVQQPPAAPPPAPQPAPPPAPQQPPPPIPSEMQIPAQQHLLQNLDVEMKNEGSDTNVETSEQKPHWMKSKLVGVKKISNKERRRRQNETLRRLLAPKNALMVLNEMMPGEPREAAQFKVEPALHQFAHAAGGTPTFCAELSVDGTDYKGYGDNKVSARNDAAEQAIRDLIIKRMAKVNSIEAASPPPAEGAAESPEEEAPLPMIQLASFALHKLFAEWECDGHKVPQLKPSGAPPPLSRPFPPLVADDMSETSGGGGGPRVRLQRTLPASAAAMHPCMLLTYMRPHLEYRELAVEGDRPQNMVFTMGIDVDGVTYIGKAPNKREARKLAARAACMALYDVRFTDGAPPAPPQSPASGAPPAPPHSPAKSAADTKPQDQKQ